MKHHKCDKMPEWYMVYDNEYPAGYGWTVMADSERFIEPIYFCPFCGKHLMEVTVINPKVETKQDDEVYDRRNN